MQRVDISEIDWDDHCYWHRGEPFTGIAVENDSYGGLLSEMTIRNGVLEGRSTDWYPNGTKRSERWYLMNAIHGLDVEWFETGRVRKRSCCEYGIILESQSWDEQGTPVSSYRLAEADPNFNLLQTFRALNRRSGQ